MTTADDDTTEQQIAAAIAPLLAQWEATAAQLTPSEIETALDEVLLALLVDYLIRAGITTVRQLRRAEATYAEPIDLLAERHAREAITQAGRWVWDTLHNISAARALGEIDEERGQQDAQMAAERIAVQTTTFARESVRNAVANEIGATIKTWRTRRDTRVRPSHYALEGAQAALDEPFVSGAGVQIWHPGDPMAPLSETAGCRCRLSYRLVAS